MASPRLHQLGSVSRVPATDIEDIIVKSLDAHLIAQKERPASERCELVETAKLLLEQVARIDVHEDRLVVRLKADGSRTSN